MFNKITFRQMMTALLIVVLLAACAPVATPVPPTAKPQETKKLKIGMSVLNLANPFFVALTKGAQAEADKLGVELVIVDPKDDVNAQVTQVENFINGGFDGFVVTATDPAAISPLTKEALDKGMKVVAHTSDLGEANQTALVWAVEHDMGYTLGLQAGEWAKKNIPAGQTLKVGVLNYDTLPQVIKRREGIIDGIKEVFKGTVEVIGSVTAGDPNSGLKAAETWLTANPDMQMIVGINDGGALGAYQAVVAAGKNDPTKFFVGGIDATDEALAAIKEGSSYQATVDQQPGEMGALCVRTVVAALKGEPFEKINAIKLAAVNASNVADFIKTPAQAQATAKPAETKKLKVGMSVLNLANPFFVALTKGAQAEADKLGVELVIVDPKDDVNAQVTQVENFINGGFDGFVVTATDPAAISPLTKEALDKGMKVVAHTSDLGAANQTALVWAVEHDMGHTLGLQAGEWAKKNIPAGQTLKVGVLNYDTLPQVIQRREGIIDGIKEVFTGTVEVVGSVTAGDPNSGLKAAETWLTANPDMQMIVGINDGGALGAYQAVIAAGKNDPTKFFVGGIDATDEALAAIKDGGAYQATVDQQPGEMGALCVRIVVAALRGESFELVNAIKLAPVNASNVADFIKK